jgi:hypothetical protein
MTHYVVQSVHLRRDAFTKGEAIAWVRDHGYRPLKEVHATPHEYRFRLVDPDRTQGARIRSVSLGSKGNLLLAYL